MALPKLFALPNFSVSSFLSCKPHFFRSCVSSFHKLNGMGYVYFQVNEEISDKVDINFTFNYKSDSLTVSKPVCLRRNRTDTLDTFLNRLNIKLSNLLVQKINKKKSKNQMNRDPLELPNLELCVTLNDEPLSRSTVLQEIMDSDTDGNLKLKILDEIYNVVLNAPIITCMSLPEKIFVGNPCYPDKFVGFSVCKEKSTFTWFKSTNGCSGWKNCGKGFFYIPANNDLGYFLKIKCSPVNQNSKEGPEYEVVSSLPVQGSLDFGEILKRHEHTKEKTSSDEIRIVSYNILADMYTTTKEAKTTLFVYCDPDILDLCYRKNLWNFELLGYNADLICLQEVDSKVFEFNFQPLFEHAGFGGNFYEKNNLKEGTAMFYKSDKFELLKSTVHSFSKEILTNPLFKDFCEKIISNENLTNRLNNIYSQIQISILKCLGNESHIIVIGNTHLYFHPDADHIRLLQGITAFRILLSAVEDVKKLYPEKLVSLILCGDFNSTPECGFHSFLNGGVIDSSHPEWKCKEDEIIEGISLKHSLTMESAYGTPKYTNYTSLFKECLDYIYYQTEHLELKQIVPIPSEEILSQYEGLPNKFFPSDHVALIADLKFKKT